MASSDPWLQIQDLEIGILVNNVGISYNYPDFLVDIPEDRIDALVQLNVVAGTKLTQKVIPDMVERKRGAIINIASASGNMPVPLLTVYSATKVGFDKLLLTWCVCWR